MPNAMAWHGLLSHMTFLDSMGQPLKASEEKLSNCWWLIATYLMRNKTWLAAEIQEMPVNNAMKFCTE